MKTQSSVLDVLVQTKRTVDFETWIRMIDARVNESIKPYLGKFTLWTLGNIHIEGPTGKCGESLHRLSADAPQFLTSGYSPKTQGLFYNAPRGDRVHSPLEVFGLNRRGEWVIAAITLKNCGTRPHLQGLRGGEDWYVDKVYYRATEVVVKPSNPMEICSRFWETPEEGGKSLYSLLNSVVYGWQQRAAELYHQTRALVQQIEFDQAVIDVIAKKENE